LALLSLVVLLAACMHAGEKVKAVAGGTLSLPSEGGSSDKPRGPLKVAFSSPAGEVGIVTEVSVVFDRPVQPLGVVSAGPAPFRISPEIAGSFRWVGSRAAVFTPEKRLSLATQYRVEVTAGLQALDGTRLAEPYGFEFETLRPALLSSDPNDGQSGLPTGTVLRVQLNQDVSPAALRAAGKLEATGPGGKRSLQFEVAPAKEPRTWIVHPTRPLPPNSEIAFTLGSTLRAVEGPLEAGAARRVAFWTYRPLALAELSCSRRDDGSPCEPESGVGLTFNNAVKARDVLAKVHVTPDVGLKTRAGESEPTSYVPLEGRFQAGQSYRIQLDAGIVDEFGQTLKQPVTRSLRFADHYPRVDIGAVGRNFGGRALSVPVASRNVESFELLTAALSPNDLLEWLGTHQGGAQKSDGLTWLARLAKTQVQHVTPRAPKNHIEKLLVDAGKVLGTNGRGALAIAARYRSNRQDYDMPPALKVLNLSDLGISAKLSRFGSLVWVTDRTTNTPVAGAEVSLFVPTQPERKYTADSDGLARIPASDYRPRYEEGAAEARAIVMARRGADSAFAPVSEYIDGYRLPVPSDFSGELRAYGVGFTDRGIYRPGDEVQIKGIVRQQVESGNALPPQKPVDVTLRAPSGEALLKQTALLTEHGTFASKLRLPSGAELGSYYILVNGLTGNQLIFEQSLEVAEYRPVELSVAASSDRPAYVRLETAQLDIKAKYLFGGAASGLPVTLNVSRAPTWFQVPGAEAFSTDGSAYYAGIDETSPPGELRRESRQLDAQGGVAWAEKLNLPAQQGPELLRVDAEVTDVSRRTVATSSSALVHPAAYYVGVRTEHSFVEAPAGIKPQVLALSLSGQRLPGKRVSLELFERRYTFAREAAGDDHRSVSKVVDKRVAQCELTTAQDVASCALSVPTAGYYVLRASSTDQQGNKAVAATTLYATGPGEPTWQDNDRRSVELVLDKKSYAPGERARVLVKSPYKEAEALITVERSGVYQSFRRVLSGTAPSFDVAVTKELLPNAFIGVHLLPRRSGKAAVLEPGSYRIGYASLNVSGEGRRLSVAIAPNARDYRPGQNIEVKLAVKDARGAAAAGTEVTLYAADEGVLSLIDYRTPDPLLTFSAPRALQVATLESRDAEGKILLESLGGGRDKGRDGGGGGDGEARRDFRQTAYFNPRIITDARGEAKASFKLPESLTTYRLMAVAVAKDDRYGFAQERVTTSKPLMARPALPRFLRAGDSFEASVVVSKKGLAAGKVQVLASATGVELTGERKREVEVARDASVEVRFAARALHPAAGSVRFEVTAGAERDVAVVALPVAAPMAPEAAAIYGKTRAAQIEQLGQLSAARADVGSLSVALSSTALVGIDQVALDLLDYPYSCTEQLASRLVPLVSLGELGKALGFAAPPDARRRAEQVVGEILARQQGDGGFAMWPESGRSTDWVSPYATLALLRASQHGVKVPKSAFDRARDYLRRVADVSDRNEHELPSSAFALDVLAELGTPDAGGVNRLFERRKELPLFGKALLLHAAIKAKLGSDVPKELTRLMEASLHVNGDRALIVDDAGGRYGELLDSQARTQALVLRALAATGKHALLTELARGLIGSRKQGRFRTTQEGAWALLALSDYRRVAEPEAPSFRATVSLAGEQLGASSFGKASAQAQRFELPLAELVKRGAQPLLFEKSGDGQLFYEARLRYVRRELPKTPLDAGFFVEKSLHSVAADKLKQGGIGAPAGLAREVAAGDLVMVDLSVVVPAPREYVVIDDPLPAGLEAVDPRLATTADWLKMSGFADSSCVECAQERAPARPYDRSEVRDDRVLFFADQLPAGLHHYRYLARATTFGRFVLPPTRAEEMYEPEVFGRSAASEVTVR
jgi:uncharacterized protein YfaS (alpha-2-macroglobulin family)